MDLGVAGVVKDYTVVVGSNPNVQPYSRWGNLDVSEDVSKYGQIVTASVVNSNSIDAVVCKISPINSIYVYAHTVESVVIRVLYRE